MPVSASSATLWKAALVPVIALMVGAGLAYFLAGMGKGFGIKFGDGTMEINVAADESFASFLDRILADDDDNARRAEAARRDLEARDFHDLSGPPSARTVSALARLGYHHVESVELRRRDIYDLTAETLPWRAVTLLRQKGYYHVTAPELVDRLETGTSEEVVLRLRQMFWDGKGPFQPPEAYRGAGEKLVDAINQLAIMARDQGEVLSVYERLFLDYLTERGIFRTPDLVGILAPMRFGSPHERKFYPCERANLPIGVTIIVQHDGGWIDGVVGGALRDSEVCAGAPSTGEMLGGAPLPIGFYPPAFAIDEAMLQDGGHVVDFILYPQEMTIRDISGGQ